MKKNNAVEKYTYKVEWSAENKTHIAGCLEFPSLLAHGKTTQAALLEIEKVVAETIKWMKEDGEEIPEPIGLKIYKEHLTIKLPKEIHRRIAVKSAEEGISINQYILARIV